MSEGQTLGPDQIGRFRTSHAYDPDLAFEPDRDDTSNRAGPRIARVRPCRESSRLQKPTSGCRTPCRDCTAGTKPTRPIRVDLTVAPTVSAGHGLVSDTVTKM